MTPSPSTEACQPSLACDRTASKAWRARKDSAARRLPVRSEALYLLTRVIITLGVAKCRSRGRSSHCARRGPRGGVSNKGSSVNLGRPLIFPIVSPSVGSLP